MPMSGSFMDRVGDGREPVGAARVGEVDAIAEAVLLAYQQSLTVKLLEFVDRLVTIREREAIGRRVRVAGQRRVQRHRARVADGRRADRARKGVPRASGVGKGDRVVAVDAQAAEDREAPARAEPEVGSVLGVVDEGDRHGASADGQADQGMGDDSVAIGDIDRETVAGAEVPALEGVLLLLPEVGRGTQRSQRDERPKVDRSAGRSGHLGAARAGRRLDDRRRRAAHVGHPVDLDVVPLGHARRGRERPIAGGGEEAD